MKLLLTVRSMLFGAWAAFFANPGIDTFTHLWGVYAGITLVSCVTLVFLLGLAQKKDRAARSKSKIWRWWFKWGLGLPVMIVAHGVRLLWEFAESQWNQRNAGNRNSAGNTPRRPPP